MRKKISQSEALGMKAQIAHMKQQDEIRRNAYAQNWPNGIHLQSLNVDSVTEAKLKTARRLGYSLVAITPNIGQVDFYAVKN
jgi:hypothetical protein